MSQYKGFYSVRSIADAAEHFANREEVSHEKLIEYLQNWEAAEQMRALDGFPPSHRDEPFCECSVCMGFVSVQSSRK